MEVSFEYHLIALAVVAAIVCHRGMAWPWLALALFAWIGAISAFLLLPLLGLTAAGLAVLGLFYGSGLLLLAGIDAPFKAVVALYAFPIALVFLAFGAPIY